MLFPGRRAYDRCSAPGLKNFEARKENIIAVREGPVLAKCVQVIKFWRELWAIDRNQLWQPGKEQVGQAVCSWANLCHLLGQSKDALPRRQPSAAVALAASDILRKDSSLQAASSLLGQPLKKAAASKTPNRSFCIHFVLLITHQESSHWCKFVGIVCTQTVYLR